MTRRGRPTRTGLPHKTACVRVPVHLLDMVRNEGINLSMFVTSSLRMRYEKELKIDGNVMPTGKGPETLSDWILANWDGLQLYLYRENPRRKEETPPSWGPEDKSLDPWVAKASNGRWSIARGWLRRMYPQLVKRRQEALRAIHPR